MVGLSEKKYTTAKISPNRRMGRIQMEEEQKSQIMAHMLRFVTPPGRNAPGRKRKSWSANKLGMF